MNCFALVMRHKLLIYWLHLFPLPFVFLHDEMKSMRNASSSFFQETMRKEIFLLLSLYVAYVFKYISSKEFHPSFFPSLLAFSSTTWLVLDIIIIFFVCAIKSMYLVFILFGFLWSFAAISTSFIILQLCVRMKRRNY